MNVRGNPLKRSLREGGTVRASFIRLPEPGLAEILGYAGFDAVILDGEHGAIGWTEAERMILAAHGAGVTPIMRVERNDPQHVMRALDIGALGVLAPHVRSEADARQLREGGLYPPEGHRGVGMGRPARWGAVPAEEYFPTMNREILLMAMIEDHEAVERIEAIAAVGLDVLFVGTADLAASIGRPGQVAHPEVMALGDRVVAAARKHGAAAGFPARSVAMARDALERGYRWVSLGTAETLLLDHSRHLLAAVWPGAGADREPS